MRETLLTLWNLTPIRLAIRLANTGLNLVTTRELITALTRADLGLTLIAIAWLIPWEKVAVLAYRLIRTAAKEHTTITVTVTVTDQDGLTPPTRQDRPDERVHARKDLYAVKKSMRARAIWMGAFSVGMWSASGMRMSVVRGISKANFSAYSTFSKLSSSPQISNLGAVDRCSAGTRSRV